MVPCFFMNVEMVFRAGIYLFKISIRNTKTMNEICSKLTTRKAVDFKFLRSLQNSNSKEQVGTVWLILSCTHNLSGHTAEICLK